MNLTNKIILTDTNILTDLENAGLLKQFCQLDNIYISDLIKNDEINNSTGNLKYLNQIKTINATTTQVFETRGLKLIEPKLSIYDILNYILARDNNYILATGDNKLKKYCENNNVKVIRTLKIIQLMLEQNIITITETIEALEKLKKNPNTRIPHEDINNLIKNIQKITN